MFYFTTTRF